MILFLHQRCGQSKNFFHLLYSYLILRRLFMNSFTKLCAIKMSSNIWKTQKNLWSKKLQSVFWTNCYLCKQKLIFQLSKLCCNVSFTHYKALLEEHCSMYLKPYQPYFNNQKEKESNLFWSVKLSNNFVKNGLSVWKKIPLCVHWLNASATFVKVESNILSSFQHKYCNKFILFSKKYKENLLF